jgi:DNA polymerase-3 subunit beta
MSASSRASNDKVLRVASPRSSRPPVARVAAISSERARPVKMSLARDLLAISAASADQGSASEELDGDPGEV